MLTGLNEASPVPAQLDEPSAEPIRVMLADDHRLLREGVRRALEDAGILVVAEAGNGQEALRMAEHTHPQVVLMDISMPILDGIGATRALLQRQPALAIVMLTMFTDPATLARAAQAGAVGWLGKDCTTEEIIETVEVAAAGGLLGNLGTVAVPVGPSHSLTAREVEVLTLVAQGASSAQLAARLYISPRTVKNHLASIYDKLDARDRTQALVQAARLGIVNLG